MVVLFLSVCFFSLPVKAFSHSFLFSTVGSLLFSLPVIYDSCPQAIEAGIWWPRTKFGLPAAVPCPRGSIGKDASQAALPQLPYHNGKTMRKLPRAPSLPLKTPSCLSVCVSLSIIYLSLSQAQPCATVTSTRDGCLPISSTAPPSPSPSSRLWCVYCSVDALCYSLGLSTQLATQMLFIEHISKWPKPTKVLYRTQPSKNNNDTVGYTQIHAAI